MNPEFKEWLSIIALLISIGGAFYAWLTSGSKKAMSDLDAFKRAEAERWEKINVALADHERRVGSVENELRHLPSQKDVHQLQLSLADIRNELTKVAASAEQSARTGARVEAYLLEHAK